VFLLSAVATLLNVFSTRLGRVADRVDQHAHALEKADAKEADRISVQLAYLRRRSLVLDIAVVLGAIGGAATCGAVLTLFIGTLHEAAARSVLLTLFGMAICCTIGALIAFVIEMLLAGRGIRTEVAKQRQSAAQIHGRS
jgi:hypothetical protein